MVNNPLVICPTCFFIYHEASEQWRELNGYLRAMIDDQNIPRVYRRCPNCRAAYLKLNGGKNGR